MKSNIDLTENRMFRDNTTFSGIINCIRHIKFPWGDDGLSLINSKDELDLEHQRKSLIALGNREKRAEIKMYREMDSPDYCDCCGARMNLKPWDKEIGICHKCEEYYENEPDRDKCLWRKKEVIRNTI